MCTRHSKLATVLEKIAVQLIFLLLAALVLLLGIRLAGKTILFAQAEKIEIINNLVVNIIENSYGKPYIKLDTVHFEALRASKAENYKLIYNGAAKAAHLSDTVRPMMQEMYGQLLDDLRENHTTSPIFTHHIAYVTRSYYPRVKPYADCDPNQIVVDYIASMTDDYFIDLHHYLFPNSPYKVVYKGYFDGREAPAHV